MPFGVPVPAFVIELVYELADLLKLYRQPRRSIGQSLSGMCQPRRIAPLVIFFALTIQGSAQVIPSTDAPPGSRTGMIVGQVADAATGDPVSEAVVMLTLPKYFNNPTTPKGRVMADGDGLFFFADLPAGDYYLRANKDGYAPGEYGQRRPWGEHLLVSLGEGERRADVTLRVWKYAAIGGTVVDEAGEPVVGVVVRALIKHVVSGRTQYGTTAVVPELVPSATTDDRGMFRLARLTPGTYVVVVPSTQTTLPAAYLAGPDPTLRTELVLAGVVEVTPLGDSRTLQVGDSALMTSSRVMIPPPPSPSGRVAVYRTTFYPTAMTAGAATPITLNAGDERTDLAIALQPEAAVRVSGRLVTPDGSVPPPTTIRLIGETMRDVITAQAPTGPDDVGFQTVSGMSDSTGRFTLLGVPSGDYVLTQASRFLSAATQDGRPAYWMFHPVRVGTEDISDLTVQLRPALRVEGRMDFRATHGSKPSRFAGIVFETPFGEPGQFAVQATQGATASFSTVAAGGRYIARPYELDGWFVQSITAGDKDITDRVFDLQSDMTSILITMTDQPTKVSGVVRDAQGIPSGTAIVLAFPVDRTRWSGYGASPRDFKSAPTARTGLYTFDHLPPGEYYVMAIDPAEADDWQDPARLEAFATEAARLTIAAGDTARTLDLRLKAIR